MLLQLKIDTNGTIISPLIPEGQLKKYLKDLPENSKIIEVEEYGTGQSVNIDKYLG